MTTDDKTTDTIPDAPTAPVTAASSDDRLATLETQVEHLTEQLAMMLGLLANQYMSEQFAARAGAWPSKDAAVHAVAKLNHTQILAGVLRYAREDIATSDTSKDHPAGRLMVKAIKRIETELEKQGLALAADLNNHHAEVFKP